MYTIKLKTLFSSYPPSLHQSLMWMMMNRATLLPHMLCLLFIFIWLQRFVIIVELPVSDLLAPDLSSRFLNKAKDLLEFVRLRDFNLI
jgi:hypothetical protein